MKKEKGITLIALVITIIVLLILAGVSLSLISGSDGILDKASTAVDKTKKTSELEELELAMVDVRMQYYTEDSGEKIRDFVIKNLNNYDTGSGKITCDEEGNVIYIGSNGTVIGTINEKGELEIAKEGIVISPNTMNLKIEEGKDSPTAELTASLMRITGEIEWTSSNEEVATVSGNGMTATEMAVATGNSTITASCAGYTGKCEVKVTQPIDVESVIGGFVEYDVPYTDVYENT